MTTSSETSTVGLARVQTGDRPLVVLLTPGHDIAEAATVDGTLFDDLPELLVAAAGDFAGIRPGPTVSFRDTELLPPVGRPRKIVCVGQNYADHVAETGRTTRPPYPDLFPKWHTALAAPDAVIELPDESDRIDYESELAVVIGRPCRRIRPEEADGVVFGYTAANDGSVRDFQFHTQGRTAGKAWDGMTPLGPVIVPAARLGGARPDLRLRGYFNGKCVQDSRTSRMLFTIPELLSYLTTFMTLEPGDIVLTGTPAGVGIAVTPPRYLHHGDVFEVQIEGIGALRNRYRKEQPR
ncbi:fumarylacetoacetate hydrolase family protein [Nocardia asiatica]|uniref:fumarylacetoacetate hydrolase family protein n=1 Tax=Nocardia asiatica TaxID=209252 RepID=UPI0002DBE8ED|nr:fumarylacetoacetate hydrolase family protein [Nocardia asiatica]